MNKNIIKTLIPTFIFAGLALWLSSTISVWYPMEALMGQELNQSPLADFLVWVGQQLFGDSVWSLRWSSLLAWGLLIGVVYKGSKFIMGELAAKYSLVILLVSTPLMLSLFSQPQGLMMILWDSVCLISLFHLLDKNTHSNWRVYFWIGLFLSLTATTLHTVILILVTLLLLPKNYRKDFVLNSQPSRYLPSLATIILGFVLYNQFMLDELTRYDITSLFGLGPLLNMKVEALGSTEYFNFVTIYGYIIWGIGFIVLIPVMIKHVFKGLQRRAGKMYILSIWLCISIILSLFHPMAIIPPLAMIMGLSIYALEKGFLSPKMIRIWALLQMAFGVAGAVILLYMINQQFGYWGIFWGIIAGIVLISSTIFLLMMYESNKAKLAVQGLLSINGLFVLLLFLKVLPNFTSFMNGADEISQHINDSHVKSNYLVLDEILMRNAPLIYHLNKNIKNDVKIISSGNIPDLNKGSAYTILKQTKFTILSDSVIQSNKSDTFYLTSFGPNEVIGVEIFKEIMN